ncbi:hypothetical protein VTL71DRAFT_15748 [Oculimacula yallundae]|uniref:GAR domain-containing protein n=1 Tax=Oculimacula yallundae TaxID=86028 RepID=A0ABR4CDR9_9HELO
MDETPLPPLFSPTIPRFAPPRGHTRMPSRSPTRANLADDILSDLSPATTLEAFTNPSGKLKASIEAATPSERAFGLRATLASKKIQEWVDELSAWPWPAEGGSLGFEVPSAKRRKLSDDRGRRNSNGYSQEEPKYIGSLLESEVESYENRVDDITADMEDLNVEEIKRQVLDTHFSPRSRPSSSASNAPPMPSLFSSYTRMDDFTAVITATVLHSLPNLSRLNRLMDVWNIRLSVLRKVPPLMIALDDAEVAIKSGWTAIETQKKTPSSSEPTDDLYLSRTNFEIMRDVLQDKVTMLGQDFDYMLDTLEGREDTLPDSWLDRMETIETDYGSWVVSGDRKVREGEWARMARARKEEDDARKLTEAEAAETARRKAEEEARRKAQLDAEKAKAARLKAEQEAQEALRLQAEAEAIARQKAEDARIEAARLEDLRKAKELEDARQLAVQRAQDEAARLAEEEEIERLARQKAIKEAQNIEDARHLALKQAEDARIQAEQEAKELDRQKALNEARNAENARLLAEEAQIAKVKADKEFTERARMNVLEKVARIESARLASDEQAENEAARQAEHLQAAQRQALKEAEKDTSFMAIISEAQEAARQYALKDGENFEAAVLFAERHEEEESPRQADSDPTIHTRREADEATAQVAHLVSADVIRKNDLIKRTSEGETKYERIKAQLDPNPAPLEAQLNAETSEPDHESEIIDLSRQVEHDSDTRTIAQREMSTSDSTSMKPTLMEMTPNEADERSLDCDRCEEIWQSKPKSPSLSAMGTVLSSGTIRTQSFVDSLFTTDFEDAVKPQITRYAPFDGGHDASEPAIRTTEVEIRRGAHGADLASPIHLDDSFPQTPTSSTVSSAARVLTSPTSEESSPPPLKILPLRQPDESVVRFPSPKENESQLLQPSEEERSTVKESSSGAPHTPIKSAFSADGAHDSQDFIPVTRIADDEEWTVIDSPAQLSVDDHHSDSESTNLQLSAVLGYSSSQPTPEIHEAETAEYFAPPVKSPQVAENDTAPCASVPVTPKPLSSLGLATATPTKSPVPVSNRHSRESTSSILSPVAEEFMTRSAELDIDGACDPCEVAVRDLESLEKEPEEVTELPVLARRTSIARIDIPIRRISIPRRGSISSDASTVVHGRVSESASSPVASPISEDTTESSNEQSPSAGRIGYRGVKSHDISPPNSPPPGGARRPSLFLPTTPSIPSTAPSTPLADRAPQTPLDAPVFGNVGVSTMPIITSPKKASTDDQMQQQISSLLESIPARIHLTTSADSSSTPFSSQTLRPKKTRRSMTPSYRSSSSMSNYSTSSRAPTPSFTLAPAYGKTSSRPRPQSSNPEIKLYHLSRSTGEAPIKLFVRLVGEHGERVMVRVGGGWADLGEYLKEYASHHGRRSAVDKGDKVQIQDLPSRNVSSSSTVTLRGNGRSTPDLRPQSVMERERPGSSLKIRKTRRSIGDSSSSSVSISDPSLAPHRPDIRTRAPSTPLPSTSLYRDNPQTTTPGSNTSTTSISTSDRDRERHNRSSSRLSWTSDDFTNSNSTPNSSFNPNASLPLGLAGPKSRNITISDRDQEWVESMKEKVRLASAEKERRESGRKEGRASFGEMEKVGGTKRLFRKGL